MKKLLLFIPLIAFAQTNQLVLTYQLLDSNGVVLNTFVATPDIAANYPNCVLSIYPTAVSCVLALSQPTLDVTPSVNTTNNVSPTVTTNNSK